jgi:hypothetical protein
MRWRKKDEVQPLSKGAIVVGNKAGGWSVPLFFLHKSMKTLVRKFSVTGQVGGPGTFWEGYTYPLGAYPFFWMAWLRAWFHVIWWPYRAAYIDNTTLTGGQPPKGGSPC